MASRFWEVNALDASKIAQCGASNVRFYWKCKICPSFPEGSFHSYNTRNHEHGPQWYLGCSCPVVRLDLRNLATLLQQHEKLFKTFWKLFSSPSISSQNLLHVFLIVSIHSFSPRNAHIGGNWCGGYPSLQALSPDDDRCHSILHPSVIRSKFDVSCCDIRIRQPHFVLMFFLLSYPPSFLFGYLERLVRSLVYFSCIYSPCWR